MTTELIAAVDLGSNSFRLQIGRIVNDQIYPLDGIKQPVRLAAGLSPDRRLDDEAQERALIALQRFGERLSGFTPDAVRAVATNTLRVAKNASQFLVRAERALGFPIEVIAGREEARLIYVGVAHNLPDPHKQQLIVDIGGGSTEFIIGRSFEPLMLESLYMGCVAFSLRYFPNGQIDKRALKEAEIAARRELQLIAHPYREIGWEEAVGSSGSAKALYEILQQNGLADGAITLDGLERLRGVMLKAGSLDKLELAGTKADRMPVLFGGFAIMSAVFREFGLERMLFSEGALRLGVLYDLLGRYHHHDLRDATVLAFLERYKVDIEHAAEVASTARMLLAELLPRVLDAEDLDGRFLDWAARLHEIGVSIAHSSYHKHSAYIVANADMPGFSQMDQARLSRLVLAHRGKLARVASIDPASVDWLMILSLRLAVVLHRARDGRSLPPVRLRAVEGGHELVCDDQWLAGLPLTAASLHEEQAQWSGIGRTLQLRTEPAVLPLGNPDG